MSVSPAPAPPAAAARWDGEAEAADPVEQPFHGPRSVEEGVLAMALTVRWMLRTSRHLPHPGRSGRLMLHDLPREELIAFWADDQPPVQAGSHPCSTTYFHQHRRQAACSTTRCSRSISPGSATKRPVTTGTYVTRSTG